MIFNLFSNFKDKLNNYDKENKSIILINKNLEYIELFISFNNYIIHIKKEINNSIIINKINLVNTFKNKIKLHRLILLFKKDAIIIDNQHILETIFSIIKDSIIYYKLSRENIYDIFQLTKEKTLKNNYIKTEFNNTHTWID